MHIHMYTCFFSRGLEIRHFMQSKSFHDYKRQSPSSISAAVNSSIMQWKLCTRTFIQSDALQALAMLGTNPSIETPAFCVNTPKSRPKGEPWNRAMVAPFNKAAKTNQGPIIQPKLVGQATVSPFRMSWWKKAFAALRIGVVCVQGMALGCPAPKPVLADCPSYCAL